MSSFYNITNSAFDNDTVNLYVGSVHSSNGSFSSLVSGTTGLAIGVTLSAAQFGGFVCEFSSGTTGTSVLPTASALDAQFPTLQTGESISALMINNSSTTGARLTLGSNTGLSLQDTPKFEQGTRGLVIAKKTGTAAYSIY